MKTFLGNMFAAGARVAKMAWMYTLPLLGIIVVECLVFVAVSESGFGKYSSLLATVTVVMDVVAIARISAGKDNGFVMAWIFFAVVTTVFVIYGCNSLINPKSVLAHPSAMPAAIVSAITVFLARIMNLGLNIESQNKQ